MSNNLPALITSKEVTAIVPADFDAVLEFAKLTYASGIVPTSLDTYEKVAIAMFKGLEIGMPPMMALSSIAIINNRPCLYGDGALALVRSKPICEDIEEFFELDGDNMVAVCIATRKGAKRPIERRFSVDDAKRAGLWQTEAVIKRSGRNGDYEKANDSPWYRYPKRMLQMRARGLALRDGFPDVLGGFGIVEEERDNMKDITPEDEAPTPPRDIAPSVPKSSASSSAPARVVEGEILPPAKAETGKPASATKAETKAEGKAVPKQEPNLKEDTPKQDAKPEATKEQASGSTSDGHGTRGSPEFEAYAKKLEQEMMAAVDDQSQLQEIWKRRNKEWTAQELKWLVDIRDEMVVRHKDRKKAREEAAAARAAETDQGDADDEMPGLGEEDFNEFDFRQAFTTRLAECRSAKEVLTLKADAEKLHEKGLIVPSKWESFYEDELVKALERFGDD